MPFYSDLKTLKYSKWISDLNCVSNLRKSIYIIDTQFISAKKLEVIKVSVKMEDEFFEVRILLLFFFISKSITE